MFMCSYINVHYIAKCFHVICTCKDMRIGRRQRRCSVEDCALREHVNQTEVLHTTVDTSPSASPRGLPAFVKELEVDLFFCRKKSSLSEN